MNAVSSSQPQFAAVQSIALPPCQIPNQMVALFKQAFFRPWGWDGLFRAYQPPRAGEADRLCDYAIRFREHLILFALPELVIDESQPIATQWAAFHKHTIPKARKKLERAAQWICGGQATYLDPQCQRLLSLDGAPIERIYKVCVTSASEIYGDQQVPVLHRYGSSFYHEDSVLELDHNPVQLIAAGEFAHLIQVLDNFEDFLAFLRYQEQMIVQEEIAYDSETQLLERFIDDGSVFAQARQVEQQLIEQGVLDELSPDLAPPTPASARAAFELMRQTGKPWDELAIAYRQRLTEVIQQQLRQGGEINPSYRMLLSCLVDESRASRWRLGHSLGLRRHPLGVPLHEAMVTHARSYSHPRRHYVFCFYSEQDGHPQSRPFAQNQLKGLAEQVKAQQQTLVDEVIVLGISTVQGVTVSADVLYVDGQIST